jgi:hypothetical protein
MKNKRAPGHSPLHEDSRAEAEAKAAWDRKQAELEVQAKRILQTNRQVTVAAYPSRIFRELCIELQGGAFDSLSFSELMELLVAHWRNSPPDAQWVMNFKFVTKRGRPRKSHNVLDPS